MRGGQEGCGFPDGILAQPSPLAPPCEGRGRLSCCQSSLRLVAIRRVVTFHLFLPFPVLGKGFFYGLLVTLMFNVKVVPGARLGK
jgi:hypothetical protein